MHRRRPARSRPFVIAALLSSMAFIAAACGDDAADSPASTDASTIELSEVAQLSGVVEDADFEVRPSVEQVSLTGAEPGVELALFDATDTAVAVGRTDSSGAYIFREVAPGDGYRVGTAAAAGWDRADQVASEPVDVVAVDDSTPDAAFYDDQELEEGVNYIETRDGTTLAATVFLPGPPEDGPYPTVVEYSGYSPAKPPTNLIGDRWDELSESLGGDLTLEQVCALAPFACAAPDQPASLIAHALGYAVVGVNMRGTGCSGGAYDYFEPLQLLDGYDAIETVAAQDWVAGGEVGMVGLSYPAIAQLFVASTQPPSLAAITPLSVFDDTARGVLSPGGIFNEGFALQWAENVLTDAEPYGQGWEQARVDEGDTECAANQELRGQNVDVVAKAKRYDHYEPAVADPLNPSLLVGDIDVPVFLTGSFQDEQTGGRFPMLFDDFTSAPVTKFAMWNGAHADGLAPQNLVELETFLDLYVRGEQGPRTLAFELFAPLITGEAFGADIPMPPQREFASDDIDEMRAEYEAEPDFRVLLENGAGDPDQPGAPVATTELLFDTWPPAGITAQRWWLGPDGTLVREEPGPDGGASTFEVDPDLAQRTTFDETVEGNDLFRADVVYDWQQEPDGAATVFVSEPLEEDLVLIGPASADLWIRSSFEEADLGVTLSEVRPDGDETYIQSGVLRGTQRAVDEDATELIPTRTNLETDAVPLPTDEFVEARIEVFPFAHVVRAGSRLRFSVHTPGGDRARWTYILAEHPDDAVVDVGHNASAPSSVALPEVTGVTGYPAAVPDDCNALRAQPCRTFVPYDNTPAG